MEFTTVPEDVRPTAAPATGATPSGASPVGKTRPDVIILGGEANALSVARQLGRLGAKVHMVGEAGSPVRHSRFVRWIPTPGDNPEKAWGDLLLGESLRDLDGSIVLACSDAGIRVLLEHRQELQKRYLLDLCQPSAQQAMLDKLTTYERAREAGVPLPKFWAVRSRDEVEGLREELVFPLIVKPRMSHLFDNRFKKKYLRADSFDELLSAFDAATDAGFEMLLVEWLPGGDEKLCSYFTYLDERGEPLAHFTKRIIRRFPVGMGAACYHITDWIPELVQPSLRLFRHVGLCGVANVEYKLDERDGQYKLIECNARFVASNALVAASGCDLAALVYRRLAGLPQPPATQSRYGRRLWDPVRDYWAFRQLHRQGELSLGQWLSGIAHRQTFPFFRFSDPVPAISRLLKPLLRRKSA